MNTVVVEEVENSVGFVMATMTGQENVNADFADGKMITYGDKENSVNFVHWVVVCLNCS